MPDGRKQVDWNNAKEALSVIREVALILFVAMLFVVPSTVRNTLSSAGIVSAFGFEFRDSLSKSVDQLGENQDKTERQLTEARTKLANIRGEVKQIIDIPPGPERGKRLIVLGDRLDSLVRSTDSLDRNFAGARVLRQQMKQKLAQ